MKFATGRCAIVFALFSSSAIAADSVQQELQLEAAAHAAALTGDNATVDASFAAATGIFGKSAATVSLARRAAAVPISAMPPPGP